MAYIRELNLLPTSRRHSLAQELVLNAMVRFLRSINAGLLVVTGSGIVTIVILQILVTLLSSFTTDKLAAEVKHYQDLRTQIAKQNESLTVMGTLSGGTVAWSQLLPDLFSSMPPGTKINQLNGAVTTETKLSFSGQALSRSALVVLQDRLQNLPWVKSVSAPNSNLLERINPTYGFDVIIKSAAKPTPSLVPPPIITAP